MQRALGPEGLSKQPSYLELVNAIAEDKYKITFPDRRATWEANGFFHVAQGFLGDAPQQAAANQMNFDNAGQPMPWAPPASRPMSQHPDVAMGHNEYQPDVNYNHWGGFPGGGGGGGGDDVPPPAPRFNYDEHGVDGGIGRPPPGRGWGSFAEYVAAQQQHLIWEATAQNQAQALIHAGTHIPVSGPLDPQDPDEVMQAENGGPAPQRTGFIQQGMQSLAASIGGAIAGHVSGMAQDFARNGVNRLVEAAGFVPAAGAAAAGVEAAGAAVAVEAAEGAAVFPAAAPVLIPVALAAGAASLTEAAVDAAGSYVRSVSGALFQNQNNTNLPPHVQPAHLMVNGRIPGQPEVFRINTASSVRSSLPDYETPPGSRRPSTASLGRYVPPEIPRVGPPAAPHAPAPPAAAAHSGSDLEEYDLTKGFTRIARPEWPTSAPKRRKIQDLKRRAPNLPKPAAKRRNTKQPKILAIKDVSRKRPGDFPEPPPKRQNVKVATVKVATPEAPKRGNSKAPRAGSSTDPPPKLVIQGPIATNWRSASSVK